VELLIAIISNDCTSEVEANEAGVTLFLCQSELINKLKVALPELSAPDNHDVNAGWGYAGESVRAARYNQARRLYGA
jgi:hypothetical protein